MSEQSKLEVLKELFYEEKIEKAFELVSQLSVESKSNENLKAKLECCEEFQVLLEDMHLKSECKEMLSEVSTWTEVCNSDNIRTYSKGSGKNFMVRGEMYMDQPMLPTLALFSETDLLGTWLTMLENAQDLGTPSRFRRILQYKAGMPWPVKNREAVMRALGVPDIDSASALIIMKSIHSRTTLGVEIPAQDEHHVRIDLKLACLNIAYLGPNSTHVSFIAHMDPKLKLVPQFIVNFVTKHILYYFLKEVRSKSMEYPGSIFEERVKQKPDYYQELLNTIHQLESK